MTIYERIKELRTKKGWSMEELAQKVGYYGRSAISKVENGERLINHEMLIKYAHVFEVSPLYLLCGNTENNQTYTTPILEKISNGKLIFSTEDNNTMYCATADFCLFARDNSMSAAKINLGDVVFIKNEKTTNNGEIVAVAIDGEYMLKYWYYYPEQKKLILNSASPNCEPLIYTGAEIKKVLVLGKAICFLSKLNEGK